MNDCVFNFKRPNPIDIVSKINIFVQDLNAMNLIDNTNYITNTRTRTNSVAAEICRIYVHACCFLDDYTGWRLVTIDHTNSVVLSDCQKEGIITDHALAKHWGLDGDFKWQNIYIGTFSLYSQLQKC